MSEMEEKNMEKQMVERIKKEVEAEELSKKERKELERNTLKKMMQENEENKRKQLEMEKMEKAKDTKQMENYSKMLEKQEQDRLDEIQSREKKTQELMKHMANTVLKDLDKKRSVEEQKIMKYQQEKELREKTDDEERLRRIQDSKKDMKTYLDKQLKEKKEKEAEEKHANEKQAEVWKSELKTYQEQEREIQGKIKEMNKNHADFLKKQMEVGKKGGKKDVMSKEEYLMNKDLLAKAGNSSKKSSPEKAAVDEVKKI